MIETDKLFGKLVLIEDRMGIVVGKKWNSMNQMFFYKTYWNNKIEFFSERLFNHDGYKGICFILC